MELRDELDTLYQAFCETLPRQLHSLARQLPYRLKLAPKPEMRWSQVLVTR